MQRSISLHGQRSLRQLETDAGLFFRPQCNWSARPTPIADDRRGEAERHRPATDGSCVRSGVVKPITVQQPWSDS